MSELKFRQTFKQYLEKDIDEDDEEGVGEVEEEPDLHRFNVRGGREADRDGEVDRGQNHHAGSRNKTQTKHRRQDQAVLHVDGVDQTELVLIRDVVGGLVYDVHEESG